MTGKGIIDALMNHWLDIGANAINDMTFRARGLLHVQQAYNRFWRAKPWEFKVGQADVTIGTAGTGDLPADFGAFGQNGGVTRETYSLGRTTLRDLLVRRETESAETTHPSIYAVGGVEDGTGFQSLEVHNKPSASLSVHIIYDRKPYTVLDSDTDSGLEMVPLEYHEDVLLWGAIAALMFGEGDARSETAEAKFARGIQQAWADQAPVNQARIMWPRFGLRGRRR